MGDKIIEILLDAKKDYGEEIFNNGGMMRDILLGKLKHERERIRMNAFLYLLDDYDYKKFVRYKDNPSRIRREQEYCMDILKDYYSDEVALFAVNALSVITGIKQYNITSTSAITKSEKLPLMLHEPKSKKELPIKLTLTPPSAPGPSKEKSLGSMLVTKVKKSIFPEEYE